MHLMRPRPDPGEGDPLSLFRANMANISQSTPDSWLEPFFGAHV